MIFQFSLSVSEASKLPSAIALYGVFNDEKLLYIGTSTCLRRRFKGHIHNNKFEPYFIIKWNEYADNCGKQLNEDERKAIELLKPTMNRGKAGINRNRKKWHPMYNKNAREHSVIHQTVYDLLWSKINNSISKLYVLDQIANKTNLSYSWLEKFAQDNGGSPSVERLETLYKHLTSKILKINV